MKGTRRVQSGGLFGFGSSSSSSSSRGSGSSLFGKGAPTRAEFNALAARVNALDGAYNNGGYNDEYYGGGTRRARRNRKNTRRNRKSRK